MTGQGSSSVMSEAAAPHPDSGHSNEVVEQLREARRLVAKGWTKGQFARDRRDRVCSFASAIAARFCARGAILRATGAASTATRTQAERFLDRAITRPYFSSVELNDRAESVDEVLALYDRAIALAQLECQAAPEQSPPLDTTTEANEVSEGIKPEARTNG